MRRRDTGTLYFAYGSCMDDVRLREHGVNHLFQDVVGRGVLHGYRLAFTRQTGDCAYADIVPDPRSIVEGKVYRLTSEAVDYLDEREGRGKAYDRVWLEVDVNGTPMPSVLSYTVVQKSEAELPPPKWYALEILRGAEGTVSARYLEALQKKFRQEFKLDV